MDPTFYKIIHIAGVVWALAAIGAVALHVRNGGDKASNQGRGLVGASHGIALVLILVSGFGMIAKYQYGFPGWVIAKIVLWLVIGGLLVVPYRAPGSAGLVWALSPLLGAAAAWLALVKPF